MKRTASLASAGPIGRTTARISLSAAAAAIALAACASSPPTQFYSLSAESSRSAIPRPGPDSAHPVRLRVAAVHVPPALDRRGIVRRGAGNRLEISGEHLWGAPLDEMVQQVLTQDLVERMPHGAVVLPSGPAPAGTDSIVVDLLQFQSDTSGAVVLEGSWSLLTAGEDTPVLVRNFRYRDTASAQDYGDEAAAMSRLLGRLADDIAQEAPARG